jgi:hypothetical protein
MGTHGCDKCENEIYCSECYETVHASRVMQKHQQIPVGDKAPEVKSCKIHADEKLKYWCHTCNTLVCTSCILLQHKSHDYNLIRSIAEELEVKVSIHVY